MSISELKEFGILRALGSNFKPVVVIDIAIVNNEEFWELEEALTKMFSKVDSCLVELKELIKRHNADVVIDIAFYQYGTYPALIFPKNIMKK